METDIENSSQGRQSLPILLKIASAVLVIAALRLAGDLLVPVIFGIFLAVVSFPVMTWLERRRCPHAVAVLFTVGMNIGVVALIIYFSTGFLKVVEPKEVRSLVDRIASLGDRTATMLEDRGIYEGAEEAWTEFRSFNGFPVPKEVEPEGTLTVDAALEETKKEEPASTTDFAKGNLVDSLAGFVLKLVRPIVGQITSWFGTAIFVLVILIFALLEGSAFRRKIQGIRAANGPDFSRFDGAAADIQRYLRIKTVASIATGVLAGIVCLVVGIEDPFLWGLLAFLLNFIPVVGSIIASLPPFIIALANIGFLPGLAILVGYFAINFTIGNFLEPTLLGKRFGLSTLVIVISVFFWGWMWGPVGMFLAVPLTMIAKVIFDNSPDFRWLSIAMGKGPGRREKRRAARVAKQGEAEASS